ncbi:hypothetical protein RV11_GL003177 [Enterococcus phoeniculicola]|nr:hypothetical protein RV11_GL003177 [Enterococcus phoeniculicola]
MKMKIFLLLSIGYIILILVTGAISFVQSAVLTSLLSHENTQEIETGEGFTGEYTDDLPIFKEIKGRSQITDEVAQLAVGVGVKYKLLPSVVISQWAYESEWGKSYTAKNDSNFFGVTWFLGCPFPKGSPRGVNGSEGGYYMKFDNQKQSFSYYGFMLATQTNFNAVVGNKDPKQSLLILGKGGYAAAGISVNSPYYLDCMSIITKNKLTDYDDFAIKHWSTDNNGSANTGNINSLQKVVGQSLNGGECYGLTAYYVSQLGGPKLMGSGNSFAERIGEDYDWEKYGWKVIMYPKANEIKKGDVINWEHGGQLSPGIYGHTGVVSSVSNGGNQFTTYEQNAEKGRICAEYSRTFTMTKIRSLVRKVK